MIALCSEQTRGSLSLRAGSTDPGQRVCGVRTGSSWHRGRPSAARSRVAQRPPPQSCHPRAAAGIKEIVRREIQWGEAAVPGPGAPTPRPKDRSGAPAGTECIFAECTERGNVVSLQDLGLEPDQAGLDPARPLARVGPGHVPYSFSALSGGADPPLTPSWRGSKSRGGLPPAPAVAGSAERRSVSPWQ